MRIYLCDDDNVWCGQAGRIIREFCRNNGIETELYSFSSGGALLSQTGEAPDVLFLDIELSERRSGIDVAGAVNEKWRGCQIIFLTEYIDYATHVYHTEHAFYMLKSEFAARIGEIFQKILRMQSQREMKLVFSKVGGGTLTLYPAELFYIERRLRVTQVHTEAAAWDVKESLDEIMEQLPRTGFVRCHNSYIVCFRAVLEYQKDCFLLRNGSRIHISRSYGRKVRDAFLDWAKLQMYM